MRSGKVAQKVAQKEKRARRRSIQPVVLERNVLVRLAGIEPTTPWFVAKYSIQLSYSRAAQKYTANF